MVDELPDLTGFSVRHLLRLESGIVSELRRRDLVRTNNKPLGDIAEQVVFVARGGVLEPNSTKSHDVTGEMRDAYEMLDAHLVEFGEDGSSPRTWKTESAV